MFFRNFEIFLPILGHDFFICWITLHFQDFQSAAIRKKLNVPPKCIPYICLSVIIIVIINMLCEVQHNLLTQSMT